MLTTFTFFQFSSIFLAELIANSNSLQLATKVISGFFTYFTKYAQSETFQTLS